MEKIASPTSCPSPQSERGNSQHYPDDHDHAMLGAADKALVAETVWMRNEADACHSTRRKVDWLKNNLTPDFTVSIMNGDKDYAK